jgi:putative endonuclease
VQILQKIKEFLRLYLPSREKLKQRYRFLNFSKQDSEKMKFGLWGEDHAVKYLEKEQGYKILKRNWFHGFYELDIVAQYGDKIIFVEVKTRRKGPAGTGYYSVDRRKKRAIRKAATAYLMRLRKVPPRSQFDIVEVIAGSEKEKPEIHHYPDVSMASPRNIR